MRECGTIKDARGEREMTDTPLPFIEKWERHPEVSFMNPVSDIKKIYFEGTAIAKRLKKALYVERFGSSVEFREIMNDLIKELEAKR